MVRGRKLKRKRGYLKKTIEGKDISITVPSNVKAVTADFSSAYIHLGINSFNLSRQYLNKLGKEWKRKFTEQMRIRRKTATGSLEIASTPFVKQDVTTKDKASSMARWVLHIASTDYAERMDKGSGPISVRKVEIERWVKAKSKISDDVMHPEDESLNDTVDRVQATISTSGTRSSRAVFEGWEWDDSKETYVSKWKYLPDTIFEHVDNHIISLAAKFNKERINRIEKIQRRIEQRAREKDRDRDLLEAIREIENLEDISSEEIRAVRTMADIVYNMKRIMKKEVADEDRDDETIQANLIRHVDIEINSMRQIVIPKINNQKKEIKNVVSKTSDILHRYKIKFERSTKEEVVKMSKSIDIIVKEMLNELKKLGI